MTVSQIVCRIAASALFLVPLTTFLGNPSAALAAPPPVIAGRIVAIAGNVRYFDDFSGEWRPVALHQIIAQGEHLNTDGHARLALRIGSTSVWLDEHTDLQVGQDGDEALLLRLRRGTIAMQLRASELAPVTRIQTRQGWISPESEGLYRVDQRPQTTRVLALQGRLRFDPTQAMGNQTVWMLDGEQIEFEGTRAERVAPVPDRFSDWVGAQIDAESSGVAGNYRYVAPEVTLAEDLRLHGQWDHWHGRWGWLPGSTAPPPVYLRVYPRSTRHPERHWDRPAHSHTPEWVRDGDRDRDRVRPRPALPTGNPTGERPDRPSPWPAGGNPPPVINTTPVAPTVPRAPTGVQENRVQSNPVPDDTERDRRGRRLKDKER